MEFSVKVNDDFEAAINKLEASVSESVLRSAGFAGADVLRNEAQVRAPVRTGVLRANVIVKRIEEKSSAQRQTYYVTVRTGKKNIEGDAFYWKWVEFGSSKMAAQPFMRPAYTAKAVEAVNAMRVRMSERLKELGGFR